LGQNTHERRQVSRFSLKRASILRGVRFGFLKAWRVYPSDVHG
jgi:hypothetical protein